MALGARGRGRPFRDSVALHLVFLGAQDQARGHHLLPVNEPWMGSYSKPTVSPLCTQESLSPQGSSLLRPQFLLLAMFGHGFLAISSKVLLLLRSKVTNFFFQKT